MRIVSLLVVAALAGTAAADGTYYSEGVGGTRFGDELGRRMPGAVRMRFAIGRREGNLAGEIWFAGNIGFDDHPSRDAIDNELALITWGGDLKMIHPVDKHLELYLRGTISYGILDTGARGDQGGHGGRGLGVGAGIQYKGKVRAAGLLFWPLFFSGWGPKITGAVFLDDGFEFYRLHPGSDQSAVPAIDATLSHITLGFAFGSDF